MKYKGIEFEQHNGRYIIMLNKDLLDLGLVTKKTLQRGHPGYKSITTLKKVIDKKFGCRCD